MENDQSGRGRQTASEGGQRSVPKQFPPATVHVQTPKKLTVIHKEHSKALPRRGTEPMDANLPERDNTHSDETNSPEVEHKQNIPVNEREVDLGEDGSETNDQHDVADLPQPEEDEQNDHTEQVQMDKPSSPLLMTLPAEDEHGEVRRSAREMRQRPIFTYESLGQPSVRTHVGSISSQPTPASLPFMPHMTR